MARVHEVKKSKAGKKIKCGRISCGRRIKPGEIYYWWQPRNQGKQYRCGGHYPRASEMTSSDKLADLYAAGESIEDAVARLQNAALNYDEINQAVSDLVDEMRAAKDTVEDVGSRYEESHSNMESAFPNGCPTMDEIQEKIDNCEQYATSIDTAADEIESTWESETADLKEVPDSTGLTDEEIGTDLDPMVEYEEKLAAVVENLVSIAQVDCPL